MVQRFLKIYFLVVFFFGSLLMSAQGDPGTGFEDGSGNTDGNVEAAPINGWLLYMMLAGIVFAFYYFRNRKSEGNS